jgi:hypothetical protein
MNDLLSALDAGFGWIALPTLAHDLKSSACPHCIASFSRCTSFLFYVVPIHARILSIRLRSDKQKHKLA